MPTLGQKQDSPPIHRRLFHILYRRPDVWTSNQIKCLQTIIYDDILAAASVVSQTICMR